MSRQISAAAVALAGVGAVAVYAAVKGVSAGSGLRALLAGHTLPQGEDLSTDLADVVGSQAGAAAAGTLGAAVGAAIGNNSVASAAAAYVGKGHRYLWGGGSPGGWDCSGFVNYVVCHDLGMAIPGYGGGAFTGRSHGPVTWQWPLWSGCTSISRDQVEAGDLVIWPAIHMGIAADNATLIHAPGPNGTPAPVLGTIDNIHRGLPKVYRRLTGRR